MPVNWLWYAYHQSKSIVLYLNRIFIEKQTVRKQINIHKILLSTSLLVTDYIGDTFYLFGINNI